MGRDSETEGGDEESFESLMQHLPAAKENYQANKKRTRRRKRYSGNEGIVRSRTDIAVLSSNHEARRARGVGGRDSSSRKALEVRGGCCR